MGNMHMMCVVFACLLAIGIAVPASAAISDSYSSDRQGTTFGDELSALSSQQDNTADAVSEELLLIGAAVIGLIGISIMRKTLH